MGRFRLTASLAVAGLVFCGLPYLARAATVTYDFNIEYSGGQAPAGPAPWIVATFSDTSTPGQVQLTVTTSGLTGNESILGLYFNVDPTLNVSSLTFTSLNGGPGTIAASSIQLGENAFKADGDGLYDILLNYPTGSGSGTFNNTVSSSYDISYSGSGTLSAASFFTLASPAGGHGPFFAAAHIQNTTGPGVGGSGWIAPVPLPSALSLLLSGLAVFTGFSWLSARRLVAT